MMPLTAITLFTFTLMSVVSAEIGDLNSSNEQLSLFHSFDGGKSWTVRGSLQLAGSQTGYPSIQQETLSAQQYDDIKELCDTDQFYLLKVIVEGSGFEHRSFSSACRLLESNLADNIILYTDWKGNLVALNQMVSTSATRREEAGQSRTFRTRVQTNSMETGPSPDTAAYIQKVEEEKNRKASGEVPDNRSFLAKYWMYIVPLFFFLVVNSASAPENGGGGR